MSESIPALGYTTLRTIAECAVGIGDMPIQFVATPPATPAEDYSVIWLPAGSPLPRDPRNVLVPALDMGKYSQGVSVELNLDGGTISAGMGGDGLTASADAAFWSDAAVQKFVVPYVASCAAWEAGSAVTALQNAWNNYPADQLTISALLHVVPQMNASVTLDSSFAVALGRPATVQAMTLSAYLQQTPGGPPSGSVPQGPPVNFQQVPPGGSGFPGYTILRGMAEWATELTTAPGFFPWAPGQQEPGEPTPVQSGFGIPAYVPQVPQNRTWPARVTFIGGGGADDQVVLYGADARVVADAVFWTQGSIQQFMLPYYASVGGFQEPGSVQQLIDVWQVDGVNPPGTVVDGLVHLPDSAWVRVNEEARVVSVLWASLAPEHQVKLRQFHATNVVNPFGVSAHVGVLYRDVVGRHLLPLQDFKVLHPQYFS
jgi:hypothetical protein